MIIDLVAPLIVVGAITGLMPVFATKLIVKLYPRDDARRAELLAELFRMPFRDRPAWVFQSLALGISEGLPSRWRLWVDGVRRRGSTPLAEMGVRSLDVCASLAGVILVAPVVLMAALLIKLESSGPVLFRQERRGRDGSGFPLLKLRTMHVEVPDASIGTVPPFKLRSDQRVTRVGRILRQLSIDELPQFWNVLKGEMSVVGPRPIPPAETALWNDVEMQERQRARPGITGLWQVSEEGIEAYKRLDLYYARHRSIGLYLRIVVRTFRVVLRRRVREADAPHDSRRRITRSTELGPGTNRTDRSE